MPISTKAQFERRKLDRSQENTGHLMVSIAGDSKDFVRTPVSTILVLDVSGSMNGACGGQTPYSGATLWPSQPYWGGNGGCVGGGLYQPSVYSYYVPQKRKIDALKETARKLVEHLTSDDEVGLVTFSDVATVVYERRPIENKDAIYAAINSMEPQASTNMSGGLLQAFKMINQTFKGVKRIMLLTDGLANVGVSDPAGLLQLINQREGSTISTFGFGMDCNRSLLADIAQAASGNSYYIDSAEDLSSTFAKELGGMLSCMAQNITIRVAPNKGVTIESVLNNFTVEDVDGVALIKAEDVYVGGTKKVLIKLKLDKIPKAKPRPTSLAHIEVSFDDLRSRKCEIVKLNPKVEYVKAADADKESLLEIREQVAILEVAKAQQRAVVLANSGQYDAARSVIACSMTALNDSAAAGSLLCNDVAHLTSSVLDNFSAEKYTASYGATVSSDSAAGLRGSAGSSGPQGAPGLSDVYMNQTQKDLVKSFTADLNKPIPAIVNPDATIAKVEEAKKSFAKKREQK